MRRQECGTEQYLEMSDTGAEDRLTSSAFERIQRTEAQNNGDEDKHNANFREKLCSWNEISPTSYASFGDHLF